MSRSPDMVAVEWREWRCSCACAVGDSRLIEASGADGDAMWCTTAITYAERGALMESLALDAENYRITEPEEK
jgi:hypothetical protein